MTDRPPLADPLLPLYRAIASGSEAKVKTEGGKLLRSLSSEVSGLRRQAYLIQRLAEYGKDDENDRLR